MCVCCDKYYYKQFCIIRTKKAQIVHYNTFLDSYRMEFGRRYIQLFRDVVCIGCMLVVIVESVVVAQYNIYYTILLCYYTGYCLPIDDDDVYYWIMQQLDSLLLVGFLLASAPLTSAFDARFEGCCVDEADVGCSFFCCSCNSETLTDLWLSSIAYERILLVAVFFWTSCCSGVDFTYAVPRRTFFFVEPSGLVGWWFDDTDDDDDDAILFAICWTDSSRTVISSLVNPSFFNILCRSRAESSTIPPALPASAPSQHFKSAVCSSNFQPNWTGGPVYVERIITNNNNRSSKRNNKIK